jgi:RimJ/RimL family protein N-acetyltransferase
VVFTPIVTDRLVLRPFRADDAAGLRERRDHPDVARYGSHALPFTMTQAVELVEGVLAMNGPEDEQWWMLAVIDSATGTTLGDLALYMTWGCRTAEIGYTLHPDHWGHGYATEAVAALVRYLFDELGVTRIEGRLHPDNRASAMVLERTGFLFEGRTRSSYWVRDEVSDDLIYGMTRPDWEAWTGRPRSSPDEIRLVEVTGDLFREVYSLQTHKSQESFVAPMPKSLSQALLAPSHSEHPAIPWYRAIEADGVIAGFVMVAMPSPQDPDPFLWRLLVDRLHQRRGIAARALDLVEDEVRGWGAGSWLTSWVPGRGSPDPFYRGRGFEPTGEVDEGEIVARQQL